MIGLMTDKLSIFACISCRQCSIEREAEAVHNDCLPRYIHGGGREILSKSPRHPGDQSGSKGNSVHRTEGGEVPLRLTYYGTVMFLFRCYVKKKTTLKYLLTNFVKVILIKVRLLWLPFNSTMIDV